MRDATILRRFGKAVRERRLTLGMTQERLAEAAELHENYISRLETGRQEPGLLVLLRLARALRVKAEELLRNL